MALAALMLCVAIAEPGAAGAERPRNLLIVPGASIGPIRLGESRAAAQAMSGPERGPRESAADLHFYPRLQLFVGYRSGRVDEVDDSAIQPGAAPAVAAYHTASNFGVNDSFARFSHLYPRRRCRSGSYLGGQQGTEDYVETNCIVTAAGGGFTLFVFTGPVSATPDCAQVSVGTKALLAAAESAPLP